MSDQKEREQLEKFLNLIDEKVAKRKSELGFNRYAICAGLAGIIWQLQQPPENPLNIEFIYLSYFLAFSGISFLWISLQFKSIPVNIFVKESSYDTTLLWVTLLGSLLMAFLAKWNSSLPFIPSPIDVFSLKAEGIYLGFMIFSGVFHAPASIFSSMREEPDTLIDRQGEQIKGWQGLLSAVLFLYFSLYNIYLLISLLISATAISEVIFGFNLAIAHLLAALLVLSPARESRSDWLFDAQKALYLGNEPNSAIKKKIETGLSGTFFGDWLRENLNELIELQRSAQLKIDILKLKICSEALPADSAYKNEQLHILASIKLEIVALKQSLEEKEKPVRDWLRRAHKNGYAKNNSDVFGHSKNEIKEVKINKEELEREFHSLLGKIEILNKT